MSIWYQTSFASSTLNWGTGITVETRLSQEITAQSDTIITIVKWKLGIGTGSPSDNVNLNIYQGGTNPENGTLVAGPISVAGNTLPPAADDDKYVSFVLPTPLSITNGTKYYFTFTRDTLDGSNGYQHRFRDSDEFAYSQAWNFIPVNGGWAPANGGNRELGIQIGTQTILARPIFLN